MTVNQKEKQRYYVKWVLISILIIIVFVGIYGSIEGLKDSRLLLIILAHMVTLTSVFFGFHMKTKVQP